MFVGLVLKFRGPREPPVMMASLPSSGRITVPPFRFVDDAL